MAPLRTHHFLAVLALALLVYGVSAQTSFRRNFKLRGPKGFAKLYPNGTVLLLYTKNHQGSFRSKTTYFHGFFTARIKLPCGDSSGIVTSFFLSSGGSRQDEVDIEFLGNVNPNKIVLHTNVFQNGGGNNPEGYSLWFNPCLSFHKYTIWWNSKRVVWLVDDIPIRVHSRFIQSTNTQNPFPMRPMYIYGSIWNGSGWATQSGLIKPNFKLQPWRAYYNGFDLTRTCRYYKPKNQRCLKTTNNSWDRPLTRQRLEAAGEYREKHLIYSYLSG